MAAIDLSREQALRAPRSLGVESPAFREGGAVPRAHSSFGDDVSPELRVSGVPRDAVRLAIVVDDPDAPRGTFTHWLAWNLPFDHAKASPFVLPQGADVLRLGATVGTNDFGFARYMGPKPPSGTHRYRFHVFAQSKLLGAPPEAEAARVWEDLAGKVLAWGLLTGSFTRP